MGGLVIDIVIAHWLIALQMRCTRFFDGVAPSKPVPSLARSIVRTCTPQELDFSSKVSHHYLMAPAATRFPDSGSAGSPAILQANIRKDGAVRSIAGSTVE